MRMTIQLEQAKKELENMRNYTAPYALPTPRLSPDQNKINQQRTDLSQQTDPITPTTPHSLLQKKIQRPKDLSIQKHSIVKRGKKHNDLISSKEPYPKASPTRMDISKQLNHFELQKHNNNNNNSYNNNSYNNNNNSYNNNSYNNNNNNNNNKRWY